MVEATGSGRHRGDAPELLVLFVILATLRWMMIPARHRKTRA